MNLLTSARALIALAFLTLAANLSATAVFEITEIYAGITGEDGTDDWFELTNVGTSAGSTDGLFYDDESADPTVDAPLTAFDLAPGESAVFIQRGTANDIELFRRIWGDVAKVGTANGGGGLSQNGDAVFVFDGNQPGATLIDSVEFPGSPFVNTLKTLEVIDGVVGLSELGVNGAYESDSFFNDNLSLPNDTATLIGSPGTAIPEPTTVALLTLGAAAIFLVLRRRS